MQLLANGMLTQNGHEGVAHSAGSLASFGGISTSLRVFAATPRNLGDHQ